MTDDDKPKVRPDRIWDAVKWPDLSGYKPHVKPRPDYSKLAPIDDIEGLRSAAQGHAAAIIAHLAELAFEAASEAVQLAACRELLDRGFGKIDGEGGAQAVVMNVNTGVPR